MRHSRTCIFILGLLLLSACGRTGGNSGRQSLPASTGYYDGDGVDYVHGGDTRVDEALKQEPPAQDQPADQNPGGVTPPAVEDGQKPAPAPVPDAPEEQKPLREQLKEFEISRYDQGVQTPSRFGAQSFRVKFFRKNQKSIEFTGHFTGTKPHLLVNSTAEGYSLSGYIDDQTQQSKGEFIVSKGADSARVFYWAYRASMRVREDRTRVVVDGSSFDQQLKSLRDRTFGWVHNWTVVRGRAFYIVDIVRVLQQGETVKPGDALFSVKGESKRTGDQVHSADVVGGNGPQDALLVGNSEEGAGRTFAITLADDSSKELNEVMIDIDLDEGNSPGITPDAPDGNGTPDTGPIVEPRPDNPGPGSDIDDGGGDTDNGGQEPVVSSNGGYLKVNMTLTRTAKMTKDFGAKRNLDIEGVQKYIREFKAGGRGGIANFFKYANPFRKIMETIGQTFDVSPAYAYLTVVESAYFTGGKYVIERPKRRDGTLISSALGPFQILEGTASGNIMKMHVTDLWKSDPTYDDDKQDERRYFVPAACGAARYMKYLVGLFDDSDSTVSILGYFQGEGGAAAAVYCAFDPKETDRDACMKKINRSFTGGDYGRFMKAVKNYNYTYAEMARKSLGLTSSMKDYVNKKLAMYFIASDMSKHAFDIAPDAPRNLPGETVMPSRKLNDKECDAAIRPIL